MNDVLRSLWKRALLRNIHYQDSHKKLDALYRLVDPWGMGSDEEQTRFRETNRLIETHIGHVGTLLEVGCGEGHQSMRFLELCDQLRGFDVSPRAVERARQRCPQSRFDTGDVFSWNPLSGAGHFDLVVACEVLYYIKDIPATIQRLSSLGRWCFVTCYHDPSKQLDRHLKAVAGVQSDAFGYKTTVWKAYWWRNEPDSQ